MNNFNDFEDVLIPLLHEFRLPYAKELEGIQVNFPFDRVYDVAFILKETGFCSYKPLLRQLKSVMVDTKDLVFIKGDVIAFNGIEVSAEVIDKGKMRISFSESITKRLSRAIGVRVV